MYIENVSRKESGGGVDADREASALRGAALRLRVDPTRGEVSFLSGRELSPVSCTDCNTS